MKTVSLDDEAYELLRGAKASRRDSFSDVVKRHFDSRARAQDLEASFGTWTMEDGQAAELRSSVRKGFQRPDWEA
jgi:predicted CopG family antitoxin